MSYQTSVYDAVFNAGRLVKEGHAQAVKLEGGKEVCSHIKASDGTFPAQEHIVTIHSPPHHMPAFHFAYVGGVPDSSHLKIIIQLFTSKLDKAV